MSAASTIVVLARREVLRMLRQPSRIVASVGTVVLVWALAGSGLAQSFAPDGNAGESSYAVFLLPGMATMIAMFASVFASISLIQDRGSGFLQAVLVSPAPRWAVAAGKTLPAAVLATAQGACVLAAGLLLGLRPGPVEFLAAIGGLFLVCCAITSIGLALAWRIDSVAGFHGVMNLVLLPLWVLSGAMFPVDGAAPWLAPVVRINPLTSATHTIGGAMGTRPPASALDWSVAGAFALGAFVVVCAVASRVQSGRPEQVDG